MGQAPFSLKKEKRKRRDQASLLRQCAIWMNSFFSLKNCSEDSWFLKHYTIPRNWGKYWCIWLYSISPFKMVLRVASMSLTCFWPIKSQQILLKLNLWMFAAIMQPVWIALPISSYTGSVIEEKIANFAT